MNENQQENTLGKSSEVYPRQESFQAAVPYIYVDNALAAIEFYKQAFGAKLLVLIQDDKKRVAHSELEIGKARLMISDEFPEVGVYGPRHLGGASMGLSIFFDDADKVFQQAIKVGAKELRPVEDQFCGDREGKIEDPFGHQWFIASHKEDISYNELKRRGEALFHKH